MNAVLNGKKALVLGASSGIGRAIAAALGRAGVRTCLTYKNNKEGINVTREMLPGNADCTVFRVDIGKKDQIEAAVARTVKVMGGLDIAVLVAARFIMSPLKDCDDELVEEMVRQNVTAPFIFAREIVCQLKKNSGGGKILFIGSTQGHRPLVNTSLYSGTKGVLLNLCKSICLEHGKDNIQALVLSPGVTMAAGNIETFSNKQVREETEAQIPAGKILHPDELADIAVRLLGDKSGYLTGTEILVDGGLLCAGPQV